jgi:hypothetical protein
MSAERDRESVGLTPESISVMEKLSAELGWFSEGQDAARTALAFALRHGIGVGTSLNTETRWSAGQFDKTGEIRPLLAALFPDCATPVREMEFLVNEGFRLIGEKLELGGLTPMDLIVE